MLVRICRVDVAAEYPELAETIEDARRDWIALGWRGDDELPRITNNTEKDVREVHLGHRNGAKKSRLVRSSFVRGTVSQIPTSSSRPADGALLRGAELR
jgi:hypothetical protein